MGALSQRLHAHRPSESWDGATFAAVEAALAAAIATGRSAWPRVRLDPTRFVDHLAQHLPSGPPAAAIAQLHAAELYLCCASAAGDETATAAIEEHYMASAVAAVRRTDPDGEVLQEVRTRLFVGDADRPPAIARYGGVGALAGWLRITAVRSALNAHRGRWREVPVTDSLLGDVGSVPPPGDDVELTMVRERYRGELEAATREAMTRLAPDQRDLLRQYVVEGRTLEEIAGARGVHTSTVSRWLSRIRDKIALDARTFFAERCRLPAGECDTLIRAVRSDMHLSVHRLLDST